MIDSITNRTRAVLAHELPSLRAVHSQETQAQQTDTSEVQDVQAVQILQLTCKADHRFVDALAGSIMNYAFTCGLGEDEAEHMAVALRMVCQQCIEYGYENDSRQSLQCRLFRRAHCLVVAIEDQGLPFHYQRLQEDAQFASLLSQTGAGQFRFRSLGREGNRVGNQLSPSVSSEPTGSRQEEPHAGHGAGSKGAGCPFRRSAMTWAR